MEKYLPFKIIYENKTNQSLPKITFPSKFITSANEKHYNNTEEVIKHLQEIVIPYVNEEREKVGDADQYTLLIRVVFRGQKTVISLLQEHKILNEYIPNHVTDYFPGARSHRQQTDKGLYETKAQRRLAMQLRN